MKKKKKKFIVTHVCARSLTIDEGLAVISDLARLEKPLYIEGERVQRDYDRFAVLRTSKLQCYNCGVKATHWLVERHRNDQQSVYHLNIYADRKMLTWDHILPKSHGGSNHETNGRVACDKCNSHRGSDMTLDELIWVLDQDPHIIYKQTRYKPQPFTDLIREACRLVTECIPPAESE